MAEWGKAVGLNSLADVKAAQAKVRQVAARSTRCKIVRVGESDLLGLIWSGRITERIESIFLRVLTFPGEPSDVNLVAVHYEFERRCFAFLIQHDSYPETPEGWLFPAIESSVKVVEIPAKKIVEAE